jgi:hypothetical protein
MKNGSDRIETPTDTFTSGSVHGEREEVTRELASSLFS